jgi:hypothetical protein
MIFAFCENEKTVFVSTLDWHVFFTLEFICSEIIIIYFGQCKGPAGVQGHDGDCGEVPEAAPRYSTLP